VVEFRAGHGGHLRERCLNPSYLGGVADYLPFACPEPCGFGCPMEREGVDDYLCGAEMPVEAATVAQARAAQGFARTTRSPADPTSSPNVRMVRSCPDRLVR